MSETTPPEEAQAEGLATCPVHRDEVFRITLCGSTKFRAEYELWNKRLTLAGFLVYSVSGFGHSGDSFTAEEKARLDQIHLAKIDASHAIVVINPGGYIGDGTRREIGHAEAARKDVYFTDQGRTVYQLRTGPDGAGSMRYRAFGWSSALSPDKVGMREALEWLNAELSRPQDLRDMFVGLTAPMPFKHAKAILAALGLPPPVVGGEGKIMLGGQAYVYARDGYFRKEDLGRLGSKDDPPQGLRPLDREPAGGE